MSSPLAQWVVHVKALLDAEHDEELLQRNRRLAQRPPSSTTSTKSTSTTTSTRQICPVDLASMTLGYFGRTVATFHRYGGKAVAKTGEDLPRLPPHNISSGDIVLLRPVGSTIVLDEDSNPMTNAYPSGIVKRVHDFTIDVIFDQDDASEHSDILQTHFSQPLRLDSLGNSITHQRLQFAMNDLLKLPNAHPSMQMARVATGEQASAGVDADVLVSTPRTPSITSSTPFEYFNVLNPSQCRAVQTALHSKDICVIHGPPGTGKTTTLVEIIRQCVAQGLKVLAVAPSNIAVDNLAEKIAIQHPKQKVPVHLVRVGHPGRMTESVQQYTMEAVVERSDEASVIEGIRKEMEEHWSVLNHGSRTGGGGGSGGSGGGGGGGGGGTSKKNNKGNNKKIAQNHKYGTWKKKSSSALSGAERKKRYNAIKILRKDLKHWEQESKTRALLNSNVVLGTTVGIANKRFIKNMNTQRKFDVVIIDEAAQALEPECWISMLMGTRCVLAGDHCQLPPTLNSKTAEEHGLGITLFDRLVGNDGRNGSRTSNGGGGGKKDLFPRLPAVKNVPVCLLNVQYRMNEIISQWSSKEMYQHQLTSHPSVAARTLRTHPRVQQYYTNKNEDDGNNDKGDNDDNDDNDEEEIYSKEFIGEVLDAAMVLIDTSGYDMIEMEERNSGSKMNVGEIQLVQRYVELLLSQGIALNDIAIVSPYSAQVNLLRQIVLPRFNNSNNNNISNALEIRTVDGFQGREKEIVILSMVR